MASVISAVRDYLLSRNAVTDLIGQRLYINHLPQSPTFPAATIKRTSEREAHQLSDRTGLVFSRLEIEAHASLPVTIQSTTGADEVAKAIKNCGVVSYLES